MTDDSGGDSAMRVDTAMVRRLARMLDETNLSEIEIGDGERRIRVARTMAHAAPPPVSPAPPPPPAAEPQVLPAAAQAGAVRSPMVGTVFLSPEPTSPPFVTIGDAVSEGDTLVIIEAMKVMNPILATRAGRVAAILVEDGQPVEFDQPIAIVE